MDRPRRHRRRTARHGGPGARHGELAGEQLDWLDSRAAETTDPVVVMGTTRNAWAPVWDDPGFTLTADSSAALDDCSPGDRRSSPTRRATPTAIVCRWAGGGVPSIEVGCVKDFPGTWAEYQVYDGGILQIIHRISSPEALAWSEQCRVLYADFGINYTDLRPRPPDDRCLADPLPLTPSHPSVSC